MFYLLFNIVSYVSLLLLLMPVRVRGIITVAVMIVLGTGLIVCRKANYAPAGKKVRYSLIPAAVLIDMQLGLIFYKRWILSSKIRFVAGMLHLSSEVLLGLGTAALAMLALYVTYSMLRLIGEALETVNQKSGFAGNLLCGLMAAVMTVLLAQILIEAGMLSMGWRKFLGGVLIVSAGIALLYGLFGRITPAILLGSGLFLVIATINVYVYRFRNRLFEPVDIFSVGTAMNVAENYSLFPIPVNILLVWGIFWVVLIMLHRAQRKTEAVLDLRKRIALLALCAAAAAVIFFYTSGLKTYHWEREGAQYNGYILDFISKFKEISAPKPENYSEELIAGLADEYTADRDAQASRPSKTPHIIVIMDESFSDLNVVGTFSTNTEVMPFISSLKEDTVSGSALVSVYGGNTANSEYEFLTGNSMAWLSPNVVPYQQYINSPTYSMVSYLKSECDYKCIAMHPFHSSGWNRPAAYEHLGFDACSFLEDFPGKDYVRSYISDREMFEFLIETYEQQKDEPLFLFGVTMQNHGGYTYTGENYTQSVSLSGIDGEFPEVEQYLSLIHETDKAVEYLISYFRNVDEDVVIVFFGDHQPRIGGSFYEAVGAADNTLDAQQKRYQVPFFIWANYDIAEAHIECTSLNYLSSYVYDAAGIPLPPYNRFLRAMEAQIPAINANGYYAAEEGCYLPHDQADGTVLQWLEWYEALQYNTIFDKANRNEQLFPVLE